MKKSLLAVAVAAALPAVAFAQSSVTMYGIVDASISSVNNGSNSAIKVDSGVMSSSRWGVRGSEDLGGGLKAIFNLEAGLNNDDGTGKSQQTNSAGYANSTPGTTTGGLDFRRTAVVGLEGGFGTIRLGRTYTPAFLMAGSWDPLGYGHYGNTLNYTATGGTSVRFDNGLYYNSPSMGGFSVNAAMQFGEALGDGAQGRGLSLSAGYAAGPLSVGGYFETSNSNVISGVANPVPTNGVYATPVTTKKVGLGGSYDFGGFKLMGGYQKADPDGANNNVTFLNLGGSVNVGAGAVLLNFSQLKTEVGPKTKTIGLAYNYPLSKRTTGYATFGQASNDAGLANRLFSSDTSIAPAAAGQNARAFGFGVLHRF